MKLLKNIPNFITLLNLSMGIIAIYLTLKGDLAQFALAGYFVFLAALFDFFDGFAARMFKAVSPIGLQLDSLADVVSFGVAPGFILYRMIQLSQRNPHDLFDGVNLISLLAILVPWGAALRLAKFNIDETQQEGFKGLPTPANAFLIASLPIIRQQLYDEHGMINIIFTNTYFLIVVAIIGFFLMTSSFPMFGLKFKHFKWHSNEIKYIFAGMSVLLLLLFQIIAVPLIIILYLLVSLLVYLRNIKTK